jgi:anthranilate synthase component 2
MILIIDNYDSFVYNLVQYIGELGEESVVFRNDSIDIDGIVKLDPLGIVISPGPCGPDSTGVSAEIVRHLGHRIPVLGVCLGHQVIGMVFGGKIRKAKKPIHGKTSVINHYNIGVLRNISNHIHVCRYHSLVVDHETLPDCLIPTSFAMDDGELMGVKHRSWPVEGVQFHPESIYTQFGHAILANFIDSCRSWKYA